MEYTPEERAKRIIEACLNIESNDPIKIFREIANKDFVRMHGPEHHILDGASILTAYYNAGGNIDLQASLEQMLKEGLRMPVGTCGLWGVCGAVSSVGAAMSILDRTKAEEPAKLWGSRMSATSSAVQTMGEIGGPRCCKRNGFVALTEAIKYINSNFDVKLPVSDIKCGFFGRNEQCIKAKCPYNPEER